MKRTDYLFDDDETPIEGEITPELPEDESAPTNPPPEKERD